MIVIKLGVIDPSYGEAPPFYRRISSLPQVSALSFLKQHAVLLFRGEEMGDIRNVDLYEYQVQLCYVDSDGDPILLCNDTDVADAIRNRISPLKIRAVVQSKQSTKATQTFVVPTNETGTQPRPPDVTDAFADLVNCAVASANAGLNAALPPSAKMERKVKKAARTSSEALQKALEQASKHTTKAAGYAERKVTKAVKKAEQKLSRTEKKVEEALAALSKAAEAKNEPRAPTQAHEPRATTQAPPPPTQEAFIHGRHTCDACLTTPIIGKRFKATNMIDYDLCETCHEQYKGSEITFQEAKLDRDVGLQARWRHKFNCIKKKNAPHARYTRCGPRPVVPAPRPCNVYPSPFADAVVAEDVAVAEDAEYNACLDEAIRRSKEDEECKVSAPKEEDIDLEAGRTISFEALASAPKEEEVMAASIHEEPDIVVESNASDGQDLCDDDASNDGSSHEGHSVEVPVEKVDAVPKILATTVTDECISACETSATIVSGKSDPSAPSSPATKTSFVENDSGSTENFLGETLDRVADAIDSLMIVDGDDDGDEEDIESHDSWSVVQDDEHLARAAEMIGSALFHSDNNVGSQVSSVSSVPTTVRSIVNPIQQAHWADYLERLHELGFEDDEKSISILELLSAANIGVESDDEVTLEQVVNALMNRND